MRISWRLRRNIYFYPINCGPSNTCERVEGVPPGCIYAGTPIIPRGFVLGIGVVIVVDVAAVAIAVGTKIMRMCCLSKDLRFASEELKYVNTIG